MLVTHVVGQQIARHAEPSVVSMQVSVTSMVTVTDSIAKRTCNSVADVSVSRGMRAGNLVWRPVTAECRCSSS